MKNTILLAALFSTVCSLSAVAQTTYSFDGRDKGAIKVTSNDVFTKEKGYGYDYQDVIAEARRQQTDGFKLSDGIFYFSVAVPDGNYKVTVTVGSKKKAANTTVRAESRRLFVKNAETKKGQFKTYSFIVNKRNTVITLPDGKTDKVKIKPREETKLNWDDKLTIEINGDAPACSSIRIEPAESNVPTIYLCGNSTVVDQDREPWASWGQMVTNWFTDEVAVANYAESGETANSFIAQNRLKKIVSNLKAGDYVLVEFGHNDQKEKSSGSGAYFNFAYALKKFVDEARAKGATPVFVTPTQRRQFDGATIKETHADYPEAMRFVAKYLDVKLIELHDMTRTFFETLGVEDSKRALVHYPAGTYPGQNNVFQDNTHFNPYGAYEISKMIIEGMKALKLPIVQYLRSDYKAYDPAQPDDWKAFHWNNGPFIDIEKPDGN